MGCIPTFRRIIRPVNHGVLTVGIRFACQLPFRLLVVALSDFDGTTTRSDRQLNRPGPHHLGRYQSKKPRDIPGTAVV